MLFKDVLNYCFGNQKVAVWLDGEILERGEVMNHDFGRYSNCIVECFASNVHDELVIYIYGN